MALRNDFYNEIFSNEQKWIYLVNNNLLNIYYINSKGGIKDFYLNIKKELNEISNNNKIIVEIKNMIDNILIEIDNLTNKYEKTGVFDVNSLVNLFIYNQMYDNVSFINKKTSHF